MKMTTNMTVVWNTKQTSALMRAWKRFVRDISMTVLEDIENEKGMECTENANDRKHVYIILDQKSEMQKESWHLEVAEHELKLTGADELGIIYGLLYISEKFLGILPFWFWNDQKFVKKQIEIPEGIYESPRYSVKFRGWFINDEVLLHTWGNINGKEKWDEQSGIRENNAWEMAMEALLRIGGNMVIPGTDTNAHRYRKLASDMGLWVTHHHAEPLGAPMFARLYPELTPSYDEYPEKYHELWNMGIEAQKDSKTVWNLGFRGQGDCPFWANDPRYSTDESRGGLISQLIRLQYKMVKETDSDAVCCTNLYGETMELYKGGHLDLPEEIIKIWADNGFGKMVSRRQGNHNPRVPALPPLGDNSGNGIYYHASFYDLQAANHMTMLANSADFVRGELMSVLEHGADDYWIINCSNVKPHIYFLDLIGTMWRNGDVSVEEHRLEYASKYFGKENARLAAECIRDYEKAAVQYGPNADDHAGEQFANHVIRILITQFRKNRNCADPELLWATMAKTLPEQLEWYGELCESGKESYEKYLNQCQLAMLQMQGAGKVLMEDSLVLQAMIHKNCYEGAWLAVKSLQEGLQENYQKAFYLAGKARKCYLAADVAMKSREHGKWKGFYANECLTDIKQTAWVLEGLMSDYRCFGDGPHYYQWQRDFLYDEEDRRVILIMNMENHLTDLEIFELMEKREYLD